MIIASTENIIERFNEYKGAIRTFEVALSVLEQEQGFTVTGVTWSASNNRASIGADSLSSSVASAPITMSKVGEVMIKLVLTTDTGDQPIIYFKLIISNPESNK